MLESTDRSYETGNLHSASIKEKYTKMKSQLSFYRLFHYNFGHSTLLSKAYPNKYDTMEYNCNRVDAVIRDAKGDKSTLHSITEEELT